MVDSRVRVALGLLLIYWSSECCQSQTGHECPAVPDKPSCVCKSSKGVIDLSQIGLQDSQAPKFTKLADPDGSVYYSYNPCYTYTQGDCTGVYACEASFTDRDYSFGITTNQEKMYIDTDGTPYLWYNGPTNGVKVSLQCNKSNRELDAKSLGTDNQGSTIVYKFSISSCQVCPGGCPTKASIQVGIIGLVLMILLCLAVLVYFIVGAILLKFKYGHSGSDTIPHYSFWKGGCLLVKDGCVFTFQPVRRLLSSEGSSYSTIKK